MSDTIEQKFLDDIYAGKGEVRLIYADWLEERGRVVDAGLQRERAGQTARYEENWAVGKSVYRIVRGTHQSKYKEKMPPILIYGEMWGPKARRKPLFNYSFRSVDQREEYIEKRKGEILTQDRVRAEAKAEKKRARQGIENPYQVGQILTKSWGYDQTNRDWALIVEVKPRSVVLQEIGSRVETTAYDCGQAVPNPEEKKGEPFRVNLQFYLSGDGNTPTIYLPSRYGTWSVWNGTPKYVSWYA